MGYEENEGHNSRFWALGSKGLELISTMTMDWVGGEGGDFSGKMSLFSQ